MFDTTRTNFLPGLFSDSAGSKECRKASYRKKMQKVPIECLEQNSMRHSLEKILPQELNKIEDSHYGVDYLYNSTTIDQKFSFGALGEDTIKIRVRNRQLLNNSNWTMAINRKLQIEFFRTEKLALFVRKNWGIVQKRLVEKKRYYSEYAVKLKELYFLEKIEPIVAEMEKQEFLEALRKINANNAPESNAIEAQTVVDYSKKLCFEPNLIQFAQGLNKQSTKLC